MRSNNHQICYVINACGHFANESSFQKSKTGVLVFSPGKHLKWDFKAWVGRYFGSGAIFELNYLETGIDSFRKI